MKRLLALLALALMLIAGSAEARPSLHVASSDSTCLGARCGLRWSTFSPTQIPGLALWLRADLGVTAVAGPVTATGTTPPTVTLAGTPTAAQTAAATPYVELDCTTLGILGTSKYTLKLNGTTVATNVASASSGVSIPGSGLTAGWAAGASAVNDVYTANVVASAWADNSGKAFVQATASKQPIYVASDSAYGGPATLQFASASSQNLNDTTFPNLSQPMTVLVVGESTSGAGLQDFQGSTASGPTIYWNTDWGMYAGTLLTGTVTSRTPVVVAALFNGSSSSLYVNNSQSANKTGSAGTNVVGAAGMMVGGYGASQFLNGKVAEMVVTSNLIDAATLSRLFVRDGNLYHLAAQ